MNKIHQIKFRYEILIIFVLIEVIFFNHNNSLKLIITLLEYMFVGYTLIKNIELGLMYLISFTILTVGIGNYPDITNLPDNFWGIRLFGFSFNILFSFATFIFVLSRNQFKLSMKFDNNIIFFIVFFTYSLIIGILSIMYSINYRDNLRSDVMTYAPFLFYIFFFSKISSNATKIIIKYSISSTVILLVLSSALDIKTNYGNDYFVLTNALSFVLPIGLYILKDFYSKIHYLILVLAIVTLIMLREYVVGGKTIIMVVLFLIWVGYYYKKWRFQLLMFGILSFTFFTAISTFILNFYSGNVISFKFSQVFDVFLIADIDTLAMTTSSMGNLIAEGVTVYYHLIDHPFFLFFGKGFGGGVPDVFGYLSKWTGEGMNGYAPIDQVRNIYYKMHLPIYEIVLKSGILGLFGFIYLLFKTFFSKNKYSILYLLQLFFVFYVSKEFMLVTFLFLKLLTETDINNNKLEDNLLID